MTAACNFVSLREKMGELIWIKKEQEAKREKRKENENIIDHMLLDKKGRKFSRCVSAFMFAKLNKIWFKF